MILILEVEIEKHVFLSGTSVNYEDLIDIKKCFQNICPQFLENNNSSSESSICQEVSIVDDYNYNENMYSCSLVISSIEFLEKHKYNINKIFHLLIMLLQQSGWQSIEPIPETMKIKSGRYFLVKNESN